MIEQTYVDGIPTLLAAAPGPARGGITFRVGHADETLARSGITHLIEHLALFRLGVADYHYNGATGSTVTHFFSQGTPGDIADYLNSVCSALMDLPWQRLEMEKEILRTEASGRGRSPAEPLLLYRYGSRGYGVRSYPEFGLPALSADDLRAWISRYFTRDNAVLWFSGTRPPENLRLNLPAGRRMPLPDSPTVLRETPAWFDGPPGVVGFHTLVPRSPAAQMYVGVLERELFRWLRQEGGYSYTVATDYDPVDQDRAAVIALADANPDKQEAALGAFVDVLAKLRWGRVDRSDVDGMLAKAAEGLRDPDADAVSLPSAAFNVLIGSPIVSATDRLRLLEAVTTEQVRAVADEAAAAGLLMVPDGLRGDWAGYTAAPTRSETVVEGSRYPMLGSPDCALVIGSTGVSFATPVGAGTVHFAQCSAMLAWPDGGRVLIGHDGISCRVEPTLYPIDASVLAHLDAAVPAETVVHLPARSPDAIPRPEQAGPAGESIAPGNGAAIADWNKSVARPAATNALGTPGAGTIGPATTGPGTTGPATTGPGTIGTATTGTAAAGPSPWGTPPAAPSSVPKHRELTIVGIVVFGLLSLLCCGVSSLGTISSITEPVAEPLATAIVLAVFWAATAFMVTMVVLLARRLRRRSPAPPAP